MFDVFGLSNSLLSTSDFRLFSLIIIIILITAIIIRVAKSKSAPKKLANWYAKGRNAFMSFGLGAAHYFASCLPKGPEFSGRREATTNFIIFYAIAEVVIVAILMSSTREANSAGVDIVLIGINLALFLLNIAVIVAALAVLHEDYQIINGLSSRDSTELKSERGLTSAPFLATVGATTILVLASFLHATDMAWPGLFLTKPVGDLLKPIAYLAAVVKSLPFGSIVLWVCGLNLSFGPLFEIVSSTTYFITTTILIGTVAFVLQQQSEIRRLSAGLLTNKGAEYEYLCMRAKRAPSYFRQYLIDEMINNSASITFDQASRVVFDLKVWSGMATLLHPSSKWREGMSAAQVGDLQRKLRESDGMDARITQRILDHTYAQLAAASQEELRAALSGIMFWCMSKLFTQPSQENIRTTKGYWGSAAFHAIRREICDYALAARTDAERKCAFAVAEDIRSPNFPRFFLKHLLSWSDDVQLSGIASAKAIACSKKRESLYPVADLQLVIDRIDHHKRVNSARLSHDAITALDKFQNACNATKRYRAYPKAV